MKKLIIALLFTGILLSGCLNPISVTVIEDMYTEVLLEEDKRVAAYFSEDYLVEHPIESLVIELAEHVRNAGGVKLLNGVEVTRNRLNPTIANSLDEAYEKEWYYVALQPDEQHILTWIVVKRESRFEIVDGEKVTVDVYNEHILK